MLYIIVSRAQIQAISCTVLSMRTPRTLNKLFLSLEHLSISYFSCKTYILVLHSESHCPCGHPDTLATSVSQPQDSNSRESDSQNLPKATQKDKHRLVISAVTQGGLRGFCSQYFPSSSAKIKQRPGSHSLCNYETGVLKAEKQIICQKLQLIKITLIRKFFSTALMRYKDLSRNKC